MTIRYLNSIIRLFVFLAFALPHGRIMAQDHAALSHNVTKGKPLPVRYVAARQYNDDLVRVTWSMSDPLLFEGFETGDFSLFNWDNTLSGHPWVIDTLHPFEGNYCMKSTCSSVGDGISQIEVSVFVPLSGRMSFYSKVSSESLWDMGWFHIDGVKKLECSGEEDWIEHQFDITAGEHVFRWTYIKDSSTDMGDDCFYVDNIHFYIEDTSRMVEERSFQYYDLYRSRFDETPVMLASHLTDTVFMDMNWGNLPWGQYRWGVSCYYDDYRSVSDTIWSTYLDKDMTTTFQLEVTTNAGLSAQGATVILHSENNDYQGTVNADGMFTLSNIYRSKYSVSVILDGFVDYVSDTSVSVMEPTMMEIELKEKIIGIDSLYVSSTGWAFWSLKGNQGRDLQYFEIMLDSVTIATVATNHYQFDVNTLSEGDTCLAQVRPIYLTDTCEWTHYTWVYRPCYGFPGSTNGLNWSLNNESLQLSWDYPDDDSLIGAILFREGTYLGFTSGNTFIDETIELHGEIGYCLRLVYGGSHDSTYYSMSCEECITALFPAYCDPPIKLGGRTYYEDADNHGALISWGERPAPINHWLKYDNGEFKRSLGGSDDPRIFWAIRFEADDLAAFIGTSLKKVSLYDVGAGTYQLWVYIGGSTSPRTLVHSQDMTLTGSFTWHEEIILPAFEIPENEPLWIVVGQQGLTRPAAACQDMQNANGRWVSLDGTTWTDMQTFNMHYTWMLRAFVTNQWDKTIELGNEDYALQHYNLYRSHDNNNYQYIASIPVVENKIYYEYRDNLSGYPHTQAYYRLSAWYQSDNGETCESDYAATLDNPSLQYVLIQLMTVNETLEKTLKLYPNPSNGIITIEANGIQSIKIGNTMGQVLLDKKTDGDMVQLDLSAFQSGIYWMQVVTQTGVTARPFAIAH